MSCWIRIFVLIFTSHFILCSASAIDLELVAEDLNQLVAEYSHKYGCSVSGGYVYRGEEIKDLIGKYVFGDFCSGMIWTISQNDDFKMMELLQTKLKISSFGKDASGELNVLDYSGKIYKFVP